MPISQDLLEILRCPVSGAPLRSASREQLRVINELLENGTLRTEAGSARAAAHDNGGHQPLILLNLLVRASSRRHSEATQRFVIVAVAI